MKPLDVMLVGLGGGLGSVLRWWVARVVGERYHGDFPLGTPYPARTASDGSLGILPQHAISLLGLRPAAALAARKPG